MSKRSEIEMTMLEPVDVDEFIMGPEWKIGEFEVATPSGEVPAVGWTKSPFRIFMAQYSGGDAKNQILASLTHAPTGVRFWLFDTPEGAAWAAKIGGDVCDWNELWSLDQSEAPLWRERGAIFSAALEGAGFKKSTETVDGKPYRITPGSERAEPQVRG